MLSEQEIDSIHPMEKHFPTWKQEFARAIIAAYRAKLRQGVELPEPAIYADNGVEGYTEDQLLTLRDASIQAGYLRGLDEAKRVCMDIATAPSNVILGVAVSCADAIAQLEPKP